MTTDSQTAANLFKDLRAATHDLHQVNHQAGIWRSSIIGLCFLSLVVSAWLAVGTWYFYLWTVVAGCFYAFLFVCTHDAVHHTLTGWVWFDETVGRLASWPMLWPFGCYAQLHRFHHGWNGINLQDPERVQWTLTEYQQASPLQQLYIRHQWLLDIFVFGGIGLIAKTFYRSWRLKSRYPRLNLQLTIDIAGIVAVVVGLLGLAIAHGVFIQALVFWVLLERIVGVILQTRDHLEHYGLWQNHRQHLLTQLYSCRNLKVSAIVGWLMGGLNYHAVHHAFPTIQFHQLPIAFERIQGVLQQYDLPPLTLTPGYLRTSLDLYHKPMLIDGDRSIALSPTTPTSS